MQEPHSPTQSTSQQQSRSPPSSGVSPQLKKSKSTPTPGPIARASIKWIRHTLDMASTKKSTMTVEVTRNLFTKLDELDTAVTDLVIENLQLRSQVEEARKSAEICVGAAAAQFGTELRLREAAHEQTLEAVVTRYAEKEALRQQDAEARGPQTERVITQEAPAETFAQVARIARPPTTTASRKPDRSVSRATKRNKALKEAKQAEHIPAFIIKSCGGKDPKEVRNVVWKKVANQQVQPKCQSIIAKDGRVIIKPLNRETADVLKSLAQTSTLIVEDSLRWPRVIFKGVQADARPEELQSAIISQNSHLNINEDVTEEVLRPIFKHGRRDMDTTNWVMEVNPKYFDRFEDTTVYIGFMRCKAVAFEEVTQCHICLKYGHPASKCQGTDPKCTHCSRAGHRAAECPAAEGDPICANCRGKHSARDKTCSARTAYLLGLAKRTDYGVSQ